jgi:septal ring factor EnvC (AmiA/AmiB activator)
MTFLLPYLPNIPKGIKPAFCLLLIFAFGITYAQKPDRKTLEKQRNTTRKQIETTRKILKQTQGQKQKSVAVLRTLQAQIGLRKRMVNQIGNELVGIDGEIVDQNEELKTLGVEIVLLKEQYAKLIYNGYKSSNMRNRLQFLFSSDDFNQVIKRMNYLKKLVEYRKKQLNLIKGKIDENTRRVQKLMETKSEKLLLLNNREQEKKELEIDETEANDLFNELKKQEKELTKDLRDKEALARKLDDAIKKAIEEEIRRARAEEERKRKEEAERKRKEAEAKAKENKTTAPPVAKTEPAMTEFNAVDLALSKQFNLNKTKLPWPVGSGFISQAFGIHPHPTMRNITTENNGINISTTQGSKARAVFDGEITAIVKIPGLFNTVLVKHGEYFTVYSNLEVVNISKGQQIKTGQELGLIYTNEEGKTELHFEVWKGNEKQNPEHWLRRR